MECFDWEESHSVSDRRWFREIFLARPGESWLGRRGIWLFWRLVGWPACVCQWRFGLSFGIGSGLGLYWRSWLSCVCFVVWWDSGRSLVLAFWALRRDLCLCRTYWSHKYGLICSWVSEWVVCRSTLAVFCQSWTCYLLWARSLVGPGRDPIGDYAHRILSPRWTSRMCSGFGLSAIALAPVGTWASSGPWFGSPLETSIPID